MKMIACGCVSKARPFVKWVGGKRALLREIQKRIPARIKNYYEPFVGGGALFFEIQNRAQHCFLSDINAELIEAYQVLQRQPNDLIVALAYHQQHHDQEYYYQQRSLALTEPLGRAARLIYLNKTCFNGLYRVNQKNEFNTPMGRYRNPRICDSENLLAVSCALQSATLSCKDFAEIDPQEGDWVYLDPPYLPITKTSFTRYAKGGFSEKEQVRLRDFAVHLSQRKVNVLISNSYTPLIVDLYREHFQIEIVSAPRSVNCKRDGRRGVQEVLIHN